MENNLIQNIIKELQNKGKIEKKEELEELITNLHRINNDIIEIKNKNEELNNRFGLFWKEVPEKLIKKISDNEVVYGKSVYSFLTKINNGDGKVINADIEGVETKLNRQSDSYIFKDKNNNEYVLFADSIFKFKQQTEEEYIPVLMEKNNNFVLGNNENNILIEGDNYYALQMLQYTHKEKIDVIYIDPPYNTGNNDFKYNDRFVKIGDSDKHSSWLSFMKKRVLLAKELLKENGIIFISIDENEAFYLKILLDSIFGEENNLHTAIVKNNPVGRNDAQGYSVCHEYLFTYIKSKKNLKKRAKEFFNYELEDNAETKKKIKQFFPIFSKSVGL